MIGLGQRTNKEKKRKNAKRAKMQILRDNSPWLSSFNKKCLFSPPETEGVSHVRHSKTVNDFYKFYILPNSPVCTFTSEHAYTHSLTCQKSYLLL